MDPDVIKSGIIWYTLLMMTLFLQLTSIFIIGTGRWAPVQYVAIDLLSVAGIAESEPESFVKFVPVSPIGV
jgi:hypothetical protein